MKTPSIPAIGLLNTLGTFVYIFLVGQFFRNAERIFGNKPDTFLAPVLVLLLFVLSAAITGSLVLGRPILWYLDGRKADAVKLFLYTLGWLVAALVIIIVAMILK